MKFKEIYPTYLNFDTNVISVIRVNESSPEWVQDTLPWAQENLYNQLIRLYGDYEPNTIDVDVFRNTFPYFYSEASLTLYTQHQIFKGEKLDELTFEFYQSLNKVSHDTNNTHINKSTESPMISKFKDMIDDLQINVAVQDNAVESVKSLSAIENKYRLYKLNEKTNLQTLVKIFLNSFSQFFFTVGIDRENAVQDSNYQFLNGYVVKQVPYLGYENRKKIGDLDKELDELATLVSNLGTQKVVYDPTDNKFKYINEFDSEYFGGLSREQTYYAIAQANLLWQNYIPYELDFVVEFVDSENNLRWARSLKADNINNDPNTSPDAWYIFAAILYNIDEVVEQLKPYVATEITKQINELPTVEVIDKEVFEAELAKKANLAGDNTFTGANTFESGISIGGKLLITDNAIQFYEKSGGVFGLKDPLLPQDGANKRYVDNAIISNLPVSFEIVDLTDVIGGELPRLPYYQFYMTIISGDLAYDAWLACRAPVTKIYYSQGIYTRPISNIKLLVCSINPTKTLKAGEKNE